MNLFIDAVSTNSYLIIFDDQKNIIDSQKYEMKWNESSCLIVNIDLFLKKNNLKYNTLKNIIVVNWPWSFTWIRTIVICVNTIAYITWAYITPISYFDLFNKYPIIKSSSKRDCFYKDSKEDEIQIISNLEIILLLNKKNIQTLYWEINKDLIPKIKILDKIDYLAIIKSTEFQKNKIITPLYIKKPNIS